MPCRYDEGDGIRITVSFTDATNGSSVDPTTVKFYYKKPNGQEEIDIYPLNGVIKESTGNYYKDIVVDQGGVHYFRWAGEGSFPSAYEGHFVVKDSQFV